MILYKTYQIDFASHDAIRRLVFTRKSYDNADTKVLPASCISGLSIDGDDSEDIFRPIRYASGKVTVANTGQLFAEDLYSDEADGVGVQVLVKDGSEYTLEFDGIVSQEDYEREIMGFGEFDVTICDRLALARSTDYWGSLPKMSGSTEAVNAGGYQQLLVLLTQLALRIGIRIVMIAWVYNKNKSDSESDPPYFLGEVKIPNVLSMTYNSNDNGEADFIYYDSKSVEEVMTEVAKFLGLTFRQEREFLIADFPGIDKYWIWSVSAVSSSQVVSSPHHTLSGLQFFASSTNSIFHGRERLKLTYSRDTYGNMVSGCVVEDWKWSSYEGLSYVTDSIPMFQDLYKVSGNNTIYCKDYQSFCKIFGATYVYTDNDLSFVKGGAVWTHLVGTSGVDDEFNGFLISVYKGGCVPTTDTQGFLLKTNRVITLQSRGAMMQRNGELRLRLRAFAVQYDASKIYKRSLYNISTGNTAIFATVKIAGSTIHNAVQLTFASGGGSGTFNAYDVDEKFPISGSGQSGIFGPVTLELSVGSTNISKPGACFIFISDVSLEFVSKYNSSSLYVDPKLNPSEFVYSAKGGQIGEAYEVNCDWNANLSTADPDRNSICGVYDNLYDRVTGKQQPIGKQVLERMSKYILPNRMRTKLTYKIGSVGKFMPIGTAILDGKSYFIDCVRRDYLRDEETIYIEEIKE